jgi:hypothetical protein
LGASQLATGGAPILDGRRQPSCGGTSRMTRECQVFPELVPVAAEVDRLDILHHQKLALLSFCIRLDSTSAIFSPRSASPGRHACAIIRFGDAAIQTSRPHTEIALVVGPF